MRNERLTRGKAKRLRKNLTDAESKLWRHIRLRQVGGFKFRRQHPVGPYILDFACVEKLLAVEVDGGQHGEYVDYDFKRSAYLETHAYKVLRFWNSDVLENIEAVKEVIFAALCGDGLPPPSSSPWKGEERVRREAGASMKREVIKRNSNN
ncbi:MAG: endonuclease domain-containing protein [Candidatus Dadabacteria bacterium]